MFNDFKVGTKGHLAFVQGMKSNEKGKVSIQGVAALGGVSTKGRFFSESV